MKISAFVGLLVIGAFTAPGCSMDGSSGTHDSVLQFNVSVPQDIDPRAVISIDLSESSCIEARTESSNYVHYRVRRINIADREDRTRIVSNPLPVPYYCLRAIPLIPLRDMSEPSDREHLVEGLDTLFVEVSIATSPGGINEHVIDLDF